MAGHLFGSKLWSEQTLVYFQSIHQEQTSLEFESKYNFVEENLFQYIFYNLAAILSRAPMFWNHKVFNLVNLFKCKEKYNGALDCSYKQTMAQNLYLRPFCQQTLWHIPLRIQDSECIGDTVRFRVAKYSCTNERVIFSVYYPNCEARRKIFPNIALEWVHKQFLTTVHTLFYCLHDMMIP